MKITGCLIIPLLLRSQSTDTRDSWQFLIYCYKNGSYPSIASGRPHLLPMKTSTLLGLTNTKNVREARPRTRPIAKRTPWRSRRHLEATPSPPSVNPATHLLTNTGQTTIRPRLSDISTTTALMTTPQGSQAGHREMTNASIMHAKHIKAAICAFEYEGPRPNELCGAEWIEL